jgi:phosphoglycolate phosphatase-like HAD superfamily hydrolase
VQSAAAGGFALVIGVDRGTGPDELRKAGAHLVVDDLAELAAHPSPRPDAHGSDNEEKPA